MKSGKESKEATLQKKESKANAAQNNSITEIPLSIKTNTFLI